MSRTYTVRELAEVLGFSTNTVYKYLDEGKIKSTRLGGEGRFRIPEQEVSRLIGLKGENPQIASALEKPAAVAVAPAPAALAVPQEVPEVLEHFSVPNLFNLFIAIIAILSGISYFLLPTYLADINVRPYLGLLIFIKIALIVSGILLSASDLLRQEKRHLHLGLNLAIGLLFALQTYIFWQSGQLRETVGSFGLSFILLTTTFFKLNDYLRFVFLTAILGVFFGQLVIIHPDLFPNPVIAQFIKDKWITFGVIWNGLLAITAVIGIYGVYATGPIVYIFPAFLFLVSVTYAALAMAQGQWDAVIYNIVIASFALIFPFWRKFGSFARLHEKKLAISLIWFAVILIVGVATIALLQRSFQTFAAAQNSRILENAVRIVENDLVKTAQQLTDFGKEDEVVALMSSTKKDLAELDQLVKTLFISTTTLNKLMVTDPDHQKLVYYPFDNGAKNGLGYSDLLEQVKQTKAVLISDAIKVTNIKSKKVAILFIAPILDQNNNFLGAATGQIDLQKLQDKLADIKVGQETDFLLADRQGQVFIHPDPSKLLGKVTSGTGLSQTLNGQSGNLNDYNENGKLSLQLYRPIEPLGWQIMIQQPLSIILRQSSIAAFGIFLTTMILGVGSLLAIVNLKRS